MYMYICTSTYMYEYKYKYMYMCMHVYMHEYLYIYIYSTYIHIDTHIYLYIHINTSVYISTHMCVQFLPCRFAGYAEPRKALTVIWACATPMSRPRRPGETRCTILNLGSHVLLSWTYQDLKFSFLLETYCMSSTLGWGGTLSGRLSGCC